eukprot:768204-Hanusia_phi.AAC.6
MAAKLLTHLLRAFHPFFSKRFSVACKGKLTMLWSLTCTPCTGGSRLPCWPQFQSFQRQSPLALPANKGPVAGQMDLYPTSSSSTYNSLIKRLILSHANTYL